MTQLEIRQLSPAFGAEVAGYGPTVERDVHTLRKIAHPGAPGSIGTIENLEHEAMR